ncbi:MAG: hypothetical protein R3C16_00085 [Hyphomonadaceae bacterium]
MGLLQDAPQTIDEEEAGGLPADNVLFLCTGSQGEARAALSRIARNEHRHGAARRRYRDLSSRVIPGNEMAIHALYNSSSNAA